MDDGVEEEVWGWEVSSDALLPVSEMRAQRLKLARHGQVRVEHEDSTTDVEVDSELALRMRQNRIRLDARKLTCRKSLVAIHSELKCLGDMCK